MPSGLLPPKGRAVALSDTAIRKTKPADKPQKLRDGGGLYLLLRPDGARWWRVDYRRPVTGMRNTLSLGTYPTVGLAEARERHQAAKKLLAAGVDPGVQRKADRAVSIDRAANSLEAIAREWLGVRKPNWTAGQFEKEEARLQNHAFPWIGRMPIAEVGVADVRPLLSRLVKAGKLEQAHRLRQELSRVFRYAISTERAERDPAGDLRDTLPAHEKKNFASILVPDQVRELLLAIDGYKGSFPVACAIRLAPLVFVRPGELRGAAWAEFDLDAKEPTWAIPAARSKLRKAAKEDPRTPPHLVPLSVQAVAILRELKPLTGGRAHLFPGVRDPLRPMSENTVNAALRRLGYDKDTMTGHGFRHMASTLLNEMGYHRDAIERQLAHKEPGVRGVYNKAEHMPERRRMMQAWADYLDQLRVGDKKVVPLRTEAAA